MLKIEPESKKCGVLVARLSDPARLYKRASAREDAALWPLRSRAHAAADDNAARAVVENREQARTPTSGRVIFPADRGALVDKSTTRGVWI